MRYWLDTEFIEQGAAAPIDLISIGIVAEDGRELYLQNAEANFAVASKWVQDNVLTHLQPCMCVARWGAPSEPHELTCEWTTRADLANKIAAFCDPSKYGTPEFWGYYADYDWVVLCQLFGTMMDLPSGWPMYCRDLRQWADQLGITGDLDGYVDATGEHHALADAHFNAAAWEFLEDRGAHRLA